MERKGKNIPERKKRKGEVTAKDACPQESWHSQVRGSAGPKAMDRAPVGSHPHPAARPPERQRPPSSGGRTEAGSSRRRRLLTATPDTKTQDTTASHAGKLRPACYMVRLGLRDRHRRGHRDSERDKDREDHSSSSELGTNKRRVPRKPKQIEKEVFIPREHSVTVNNIEIVTVK